MAVRLLLTILTCLSISKCIKTKEMTGFIPIVGGNISVIEDFPHVAFLQIRCKENVTSYCGASILNQVLLLTAAHCLISCKDVETYHIKAYTGHVEKYKGDESKAIGFKIHENYNHDNFTNDIAMLILQEQLTFKNGVNRILLMKNLPEYTIARIAGWGWIDDHSTKTAVLKHTEQTILNHEECFEKLHCIPAGTICGYHPSGSHPQRGDSGSALVIHNNIQIGIASYFRRQYSNDTLVYTYVPHFYDWILNTAKDMHCQYKNMNTRIFKEENKAVKNQTHVKVLYYKKIQETFIVKDTYYGR